jgi:hypothetical protein
LLLLFDLVLVRWLNLGKKGWKRVDYIWLGFTALGFFGAVSQARIYAAGAQVSQYQGRAAASLTALHDLVNMLAAKPGAVCRTFIRSEYSPPADEFAQVQREYNEACQWIGKVATNLPTQIQAPAKPISREFLGSSPSVTTGDLRDIIEGVYRQLGYYNRDAALVAKLHKQAERTETENTMILVSPFLLAVALALRITKVTGELRLT